MVLTPDEAQVQHNQYVEARRTNLVQLLEKEVDLVMIAYCSRDRVDYRASEDVARLSHNLAISYGGSRSLAMDMKPVLEKVIEPVMQRYREVGWDVQFMGFDFGRTPQGFEIEFSNRA